MGNMLRHIFVFGTEAIAFLNHPGQTVSKHTV
jgi:hypothetical protein